MRRRLSVLGATVLLVAAMMVASAPPVFAQYGGCQNGQDQAWLNAWIKHDNDEQELKHLGKMVDCYLDQPPGEGQ
jgi:hypothetical protein